MHFIRLDWGRYQIYMRIRMHLWVRLDFSSLTMHEIFKGKKKNRQGYWEIQHFFLKHKFPELLLLGQSVSQWIEGSNNTNEIINSFLLKAVLSFSCLICSFRLPTTKGHASGLSTVSTPRVTYHSFPSAHKSRWVNHGGKESVIFSNDWGSSLLTFYSHKDSIRYFSGDF